ncbi:uncharacterized protein LOC127706098 [Mytilus californianus]|uniref:uncharacterized protein LOC127706098 n=1 Tax=Mytilus californianus TaxID=6549 RepID=UPI002246867E|nr:uncharacterized protein LOC127706098 [Mytilus californianus]
MKKHYPPGESDDLLLKAEKECFEFALKNIIPVNCEYIEDVDAAELFRFNREFGKKSFAEFTAEPKYSGWLHSHCDYSEELGKNLESEDDIFKTKQSTCQKIFVRLKMFSDQLLIMMNNKRKKMNLTEQMFQELFLSFVRIFELIIIDNKNLQSYEMTVGKETVISEPDAVICQFFPADVLAFTEKVIAVVEVKKEYSRGLSETTERRTRSGDKTSSMIGHIDSSLKGQHTGEMIAALPSSVFGLNGVYGLIVQGTKVTVVSLRASGQFWEQLQNGNVKNAHAIVRYSPEYNILTKQGRSQLMNIFLGMKMLLQNLEM